MVTKSEIDIKEGHLRRSGYLLDILLKDQTTKKNILWATDSYESHGKEFSAKAQIRAELVTGIYRNLIQPRASKSIEEQKQRTKETAEVFTPLKIVKKINKQIDKSNIQTQSINKETWKEYVGLVKLEIACGEAPFIVSRYNPTVRTGKLIKLKNRVGFLDKKLRVVSRYCDEKEEWLKWAKKAFMSSYGYEWQGDNILIARENLLYTFIDYYKAKYKKRPPVSLREEIANIVSWNIFQMDGLKYVIPMSCRHETKVIPGELTLFGESPEIAQKKECEGCKLNLPTKHNGKYVKVMDWDSDRNVRFIDLIKG